MIRTLKPLLFLIRTFSLLIPATVVKGHRLSASLRDPSAAHAVQLQPHLPFLERKCCFSLFAVAERLAQHLENPLFKKAEINSCFVSYARIEPSLPKTILAAINAHSSCYLFKMSSKEM